MVLTRKRNGPSRADGYLEISVVRPGERRYTLREGGQCEPGHMAEFVIWREGYPEGDVPIFRDS